MSLGVGTQLLGNIVKLIRHKVKGKIICISLFVTSYHSKKDTKKDTNYVGKFPEEFHAADNGTFR